MTPHQLARRGASIQRICKQRVPRFQHVWCIADRMLEKIRRDRQMMDGAEHRWSLGLVREQCLEARATLGAHWLLGAAFRATLRSVDARRHEDCTAVSAGTLSA